MKFLRLLIAIYIITIIIIPALPAQGQEAPAKKIILERDNYLPVTPPEPLQVDTQQLLNTDNVIDPYLQKKLENAEADSELEIIVQFKIQIKPADLSRLELLGFNIIREYSVIPGVYCMGTKSAILELADYNRVFWIEFNEQLEYYMQGTTTVINATKVWNSDIITSYGKNLGRIDGSGITVVVLDSGIDAGHPDLDYKTKTIMNLKSDNGNPPWVEVENSDTSSGHGTHCAGTVAGNGDASGGARRGVAPGANLIGLSVGELFFITGAVGGLDWVYEHSQPGSNPYNIRAVSNSWGAGGGEYSPQDSISQASERITYENNVNVVFAAGNSGGDGSDIQASNYGNTPACINVAAFEHDGDGIATFSSRGQATLNGTWPDVGAPGVRIWSTAARRTIISSADKGDGSFNPYYLAISGTSMATPHISGICALLWQAYPGMKTSNMHEDYNGDEFPEWWNMTNTRVHEAELILEAAAHYIEPEGDNGVPSEFGIGWTGKKYDFAQGYGMALVDRAVALALTLKELRTRDFDLDGIPDFPDATVKDAMKYYQNLTVKRNVTKPTDTLESNWRGEWVRFNNQTTTVIPFYTDESHFMYIPQEAKTLKLTLSFTSIQTEKPQVGTLALVIDSNGDGNPDWSQPINAEENKVSEINLETSSLSGSRGSTWVFNIRGHGIVVPIINLIRENQYHEARIPYTASAVLTLDQTGNLSTAIDFENLHAVYGQWEFSNPSLEYSNGTITMTKYFFDVGNIQPVKELIEEPEEEEGNLWPWILLVIIIILALIIYKMIRTRKERNNMKIE
ncbi:S8 family serine peptidase [[Eubacterium] cellulosolvens]